MTTALHCAALGGHVEVVEWLIKEGGAKVNEEEEGMTALDFAIEQGRRDVVELLVREGANENGKNIYGHTP